MKKRAKQSKAQRSRNATYDTIPYRIGGITYTVFLCRRCSKAWKLANPVDAWRIKSLISHFSAHDADAYTSRLTKEASPFVFAKRGERRDLSSYRQGAASFGTAGA